MRARGLLWLVLHDGRPASGTVRRASR